MHKLIQTMGAQQNPTAFMAEKVQTTTDMTKTKLRRKKLRKIWDFEHKLNKIV